MTNEFAGARWWRFDFHTHSPASYDYGKGPEQNTLRQRTPCEWLLDFMKAGIDCVAITDHNTGGWIDGIQAAYGELEDEQSDGFRELHLFPGVEITVNGGAHLLAIFDPKESGDTITALLGAIGLSADAVEPESKCTKQSFHDVVRSVAEAGGIPIPAHADQEHGVLDVFEGQTLRQILDSNDIIVAELRDSDRLESGPAGHQQVPWTPVLGSDSHHPTRTSGQRFPGSHFTWVKMGQPSIAGLRLALTDGDSFSILRSDDATEDPNSHSDLVIQAIEVSNARYAGRGNPLRVAFSPWLTSIIGGRGTGKSTIVELIRICSRREQEVPRQLREELGRFARVPESRADSGALTGETGITVLVRKGADDFRIAWRSDGHGPAIEKSSNGNWTTSPGDIKSRFPFQIFSQKQILTLASGTDSLLRLIDEAPEVDGIGLKAKKEEIETRYLRLRSQIRELQSRIGMRGRIQGELEDLNARIRVFEKSDNRNVLVAYRRSERQALVLNQRKEEINRSLQSIRETADEIEPADIRNDDFNESNKVEFEVVSLLRKSVEIQRESATGLRSVADTIERKRNDLNESLKKTGHQDLYRTIRENYNKLEEELTQVGIKNLAEFSSLVQHRQSLHLKLSDIDLLQQKVQDVTKEAAEALNEAKSLRVKHSKNRQAFLQEVLRDNPYVRITLVPFGNDAATQESDLRKALGRESGLDRDILAPDYSEGLLAELYKDLPTDAAARADKLMGRVAKAKGSVSAMHEGKPDSARTKWFRNHVRDLAPEQIDRLFLWWPSDALHIEYRRPQASGWAPIKGGSPGQRSAALLAFLLSHGDDPIILDQPEDDLDNHLIYDLIVKQLRKNKRRRQVIVATHNANIVVNGDAEQVVAMDFQGGQCIVVPDGTGCLQELGVRDEVCRVMEGGNEAFDARYKRLARGRYSEG